MTTFEKFKLRAKIWLGCTPKPMQPLVRGLFWALWRLGIVKREKYLYAKLGFPPAVVNGPFTGMRYLPVSCGSALLPKIAGSYELELHPVLERIKGLGVREVIDVGSAEGYYAIGLTRYLRPRATHCFDISPAAHPTMRLLARLNGVDSVIATHAWAEPKTVNPLLEACERPLLVVDCEGFEYELLNPETIPALRRAWMLVETHPWKSRLAAGEWDGRFVKTHRVSRIEMRDRTAADCPFNGELSPEERERVVDEVRGHRQHWLFLEPLNP